MRAPIKGGFAHRFRRSVSSLHLIRDVSYLRLAESAQGPTRRETDFHHVSDLDVQLAVKTLVTHHNEAQETNQDLTFTIWSFWVQEKAPRALVAGFT